jgi:hypothetical protein
VWTARELFRRRSDRNQQKVPSHRVKGLGGLDGND